MTTASEDHKKLFLETSTPTSASPYPSPSSTFYPPPMPASHEFANKLQTNKRYRGVNHLITSTSTSPSQGIDSLLSASSTSEPNSRRQSDAFLSPSESRRGSESARGASASAPGSRRESRDAKAGSLVNGEKRLSGQSIKEEHDSAKTPKAIQDSTPSSSINRLSISLNPSTSSQEPTTPSHQDISLPSTNRLSQALHTPLTPSRPAPPSPAPSRRPSLARRGSSRYSERSREERRVSGSSNKDGEDEASMDKKSRRKSALSMSFTAMDAETIEEAVPTSAASSSGLMITSSQETEDADPIPFEDSTMRHQVEGWYTKPIIVRDYAYPEEDSRFSAVPPELLPSGQRPSSATEEEEDEEDEEEDWRAALTPMANQYSYSQGQTEEPQGEEGEGELRPGIYRALYAFEAEGTAEMSLSEGDFVKVVGNGGVGWAVVEREWKPSRKLLRDAGLLDAEEEEEDDEKRNSGLRDSGSGALGAAGQALVPESYLEVWELDEWSALEQPEVVMKDAVN